MTLFASSQAHNPGETWGDVLVREIMQHAFHRQGLRWLSVVLHRSEVQSRECFRKHGFWDARPKARGEAPEKYLELIRSNQW